MKWKNIVRGILVLFIITSAVYMGYKELGNPSGSTATLQSEADLKPSADAAIANVGEGHKIIAYYFHGEVRCETCRQIETYSHDALTAGFPTEIQDGDLQWRVVNVEDPDNEHFWEDFSLITWSLILVDSVSGEQKKWKNLDKVWELVDDRKEFIDYVQKETLSYLGET